MKFDKYFMISCKDNKDLEKPFTALIKLLIERDLFHNQDQSSLEETKKKEHDSPYQSKLSSKSGGKKLKSKNPSLTVDDGGCCCSTPESIKRSSCSNC
jgi:hypothetical protein